MYKQAGGRHERREQLIAELPLLYVGRMQRSFAELVEQVVQIKLYAVNMTMMKTNRNDDMLNKECK